MAFLGHYSGERDLIIALACAVVAYADGLVFQSRAWLAVGFGCLLLGVTIDIGDFNSIDLRPLTLGLWALLTVGAMVCATAARTIKEQA